MDITQAICAQFEALLPQEELLGPIQFIQAMSIFSLYAPNGSKKRASFWDELQVCQILVKIGRLLKTLTWLRPQVTKGGSSRKQFSRLRQSVEQAHSKTLVQSLNVSPTISTIYCQNLVIQSHPNFGGRVLNSLDRVHVIDFAGSCPFIVTLSILSWLNLSNHDPILAKIRTIEKHIKPSLYKLSQCEAAQRQCAIGKIESIVEWSA